MSPLKKYAETLSHIAKKLDVRNGILKVAQNRYAANRERQEKAKAQKEKFRKRVDRAEEKHQILRARGYEKVVARAKARETKNRERAQWWLGRIKRQQQKIHGLEEAQSKTQSKLIKYKREHGVTIVANHATGGTDEERLLAVMHQSMYNCKHGNRENFYNQGGRFDVFHCLTGPEHDCRDDCSSWGTSVYYSANLPDPNGMEWRAGFTGSWYDHCHEISRDEVRPGDAILYGYYPFHHMELVEDPDDEITIGHGDSRINRGKFDLFGDGLMTFVRPPGVRR